jgi:glycosyltransferase involved in cell wall biosynthesis
MLRFKNTLALIVATKDRPSEIARLLRSLNEQTYPADQVIVVDGSESPIRMATEVYKASSLVYIHKLPPSASGQRNEGVSHVRPGITLTGFMDDDAVLEPTALENMLRFWESPPAGVGGAAFNMSNHPLLSASRLKRSALAKRLGLYSDERGRVLPSGFQTMIGSVTENVFVEWLPSGAAVWRNSILGMFRFDEWYEGYSYLEDLDFSYRVGQKFRLAVVADAVYHHLPAASGRGSGVAFGRREVLNRVHFVKKHPVFLLGACYLALAVRAQMSLWEGIRHGSAYGFRRAWGNLLGLWETLWG